MAKLISSKIFEFTGIKPDTNPLNQENAPIHSKNLEPHVKPGILTLRPPYQLKYPAPVDSLNRITNNEFVSFENFFEATASEEGVEVTCLVQTGQIKSPITSSPPSYQFNAPIIWIRPFWNGAYWQDQWQWLNETIITRLVGNPDSTYKNQMIVEGWYGNLGQWTAVNIDKDNALPASVLLAQQDSANTKIWISWFNNNWEDGDTIVLMRNYIPIKYCLENYKVDRNEISFHRIPNKLRIGFGGKEGRMGLGIEYVKKTIQMSDYSFPDVAAELVGNEYIWATSNKMIVQPYAQFNEDKKSFSITLDSESTGGDMLAGKYYIRMTARLDTNEYLVAESSLDLSDGGDTNRLFIDIAIRAGDLSRRLTNVSFYFGQDLTSTGSGVEESASGVSYNLWKDIEISKDGIAEIINKTIFLDEFNNFRLTLSTTDFIDTNLYLTENSISGDNNADAETGIYNVGGLDIALDSELDGAEYILKITNNTVYGHGKPNFYVPIVIMLDNLLSPPSLIERQTYSVSVDFKADGVGGLIKMELGYGNGTDDFILVNEIKQFYYNADNSFHTHTITFEIPQNYLVNLPEGYSPAILIGNTPLDNSELYYIRHFKLELVYDYITALTNLGSLDITRMGYTPSYNLVKDWSTAVVLNGVTYAGVPFIEKRFPTLIIFSPINGDGATQYDVLPAGKFLDADTSGFRGEEIKALVILLNSSLLILTQGGAIVLDPSTGQAIETARGFGVLTKESIAKFRDIVYWCGEDDILSISAATGYAPQVLSEGSVRGIYNAIPDKFLVSGCIDRFACYHLSLGRDADTKELMLTNRGWIDQAREHYPEIFRNGQFGIVWFMDVSGNIYSIPKSLVQDFGYADFYGEKYYEW